MRHLGLIRPEDVISGVSSFGLPALQVLFNLIMSVVSSRLSHLLSLPFLSCECLHRLRLRLFVVASPLIAVFPVLPRVSLGSEFVLLLPALSCLVFRIFHLHRHNFYTC